MYAIERLTLFHETVRTQLATKLPMVTGWNYLSAYHGIASARWQDFGHALDAYAITPAARDHVLTAARAAFTCQRDWFATDPAAFARESWGTDRSGRFIRDEST